MWEDDDINYEIAAMRDKFPDHACGSLFPLSPLLFPASISFCCYQTLQRPFHSRSPFTSFSLSQFSTNQLTYGTTDKLLDDRRLSERDWQVILSGLLLSLTFLSTLSLLSLLYLILLLLFDHHRERPSHFQRRRRPFRSGFVK